MPEPMQDEDTTEARPLHGKATCPGPAESATRPHRTKTLIGTTGGGDRVRALEPAPRPGGGAPTVPLPGRKHWQVGLRIFLLTAAIAVWITFFINRRENAVLESRIAAMQPLARELVTDDANKIAVVKLDELWYDRTDGCLPSGWDVPVMCGHPRDLQQGAGSGGEERTVAAGRHRLVLEQSLDGEVWRLSVTWDGTKLLEAVEPKGWDPGMGSSGGGEYAVSTQLPADQPAVLFRRRFTRPDANGQVSTPVGPTDGILMWIERTGPSRP